MIGTMAKLSWGRHPNERPPSRWRPFLIAAAVVVGVIASVDGFVHRSIIDGDAPAEIQSLLDQHLRTLERGDEFQYMRTLDRRSDAHTRCLTQQLRRGGERASELRPNRLVRLEETSAESTLVRAYVERRDGVEVEYVRRAQLVNLLTLPPFDFRRISDIWYLGSPEGTEAQTERTLDPSSLSICSREALRDALQRGG